jgi:hypothetical protein
MEEIRSSYLERFIKKSQGTVIRDAELWTKGVGSGFCGDVDVVKGAERGCSTDDADKQPAVPGNILLDFHGLVTPICQPFLLPSAWTASHLVLFERFKDLSLGEGLILAQFLFRPCMKEGNKVAGVLKMKLLLGSAPNSFGPRVPALNYSICRLRTGGTT